MTPRSDPQLDSGTPVLGILLGTLVGSLSGTKVIYRAPIQETP